MLAVDLAARSKNWAVTPEGERTILNAAPKGWRVHLVRALTSSDGDGPREPSAESLDAIRDAEVYFGFGIPRPLFLAGRQLRWVHSAAAGVGNALYPEMMASDVLLTNSAGVHAIPIAEYVVAGDGSRKPGESVLGDPDLQDQLQAIVDRARELRGESPRFRCKVHPPRPAAGDGGDDGGG